MLAARRHERETIVKACQALLIAAIVVGLFALADPARAALIGHWPLDGNGNAAVGTNGNLVGGPVGAPDRNGIANGAMAFNGAQQQRIEIAGGGGLDGAASGTISLFVKWDGIQDSACCNSHGDVLARQNNGIWSSNIIGLSGNDPNNARVTWQANDAGPPDITGTTTVGDGVWRHIAVTYSPTEHILYVDGQSEGPMPAAGALSSDANVVLAIGAWIGDGAGYSTSVVDDVKIFDTVLTPAEIQSLSVVVPEPSSILLASLGLLGLLGCGRRRRR